MQSAFGGPAAHALPGAAASAQPVLEVQRQADPAGAADQLAAPLAAGGGRQAGLLGQRRVQDGLVITFCVAFSLIGWLMIVQGAEQLRAARHLLGWATAPGLIESSEAYEVEGSRGTFWRPRVTYSYAVSGRVITGTQLALGKAPSARDFDAAQAFLARYPARTPVTVYYNPNELTEAVLETQVPRAVYVNFAFGIGLAVLGPVLLLFFGFSANRSSPAGRS